MTRRPLADELHGVRLILSTTAGDGPMNAMWSTAIIGHGGVV